MKTRRWLATGSALGWALLALLVLVWPRPVPPVSRGNAPLAPDRLDGPGLWSPGPPGGSGAPVSTDEHPRTDRRHVLVIGLDDVLGSHRADSLLLAAIRPSPPRVSLVSIPRDLRVRLPGRGWDKINAAYAYGGVSLTARAVEELLGLPIDHYVVLNYLGFKRIVDQMGGLQYTVEQRMYHVDRTQGLVINLQPGPQRLDGDRALQYVRFRGDGRGDLGRVMRQQRLLRAALAQWRTPATLVRLPLVVPAVLGAVNTNVPISDALQLAGALREVQVDEIRNMTIPGAPGVIGGISYVVADLGEVQRVVRAFLESSGEGGAPDLPGATAR